MEPAGSTAEGLKVIRPNEFDVELHLDVGSVKFDTVDCGEFEYVLVEFKDEDDAKRLHQFATLHKFSSGTSFVCFDPQKVRTVFQGLIQRSINDISSNFRYNMRVGRVGPAITIWIDHPVIGNISMDLVPLIYIDGFELVAKPHPKLRNKRMHSHFDYGSKSLFNRVCEERDEFAQFWIRSFAREERTYINQGFYDGFPQNSCHKKCLQIIKAIKENHRAELGMLRSYIFKTIFLHMLRDLDKEDWEGDKLEERFKDFVKRLRGHLMTKRLPHFFVMELNLLRELESITLYNAMRFLQRIIDKDRYLNFLRKEA